jgi:hypothetical protein
MMTAQPLRIGFIALVDAAALIVAAAAHLAAFGISRWKP